MKPEINVLIRIKTFGVMFSPAGRSWRAKAARAGQGG